MGRIAAAHPLDDYIAARAHAHPGKGAQDCQTFIVSKGYGLHAYAISHFMTERNAARACCTARGAERLSMIVTRLSVIAIAILCTSSVAEAKRHARVTGAERFLCDSFEVGCPRKPARAKL